MRHKYAARLAVGMLALLALGAFIVRGNQNQGPPVQDPDYQQRNAAVNLIRAVNTAEVTYRSRDAGHFALWDDLVGSEGFKTSLAHAPKNVKSANLSDPSNIMPGWRLRLFTSRDGEQYVVLLAATSNQCLAFVSDDSGLIRQAETIGCPSAAASAR
jgi:hypothetical protein